MVSLTLNSLDVTAMVDDHTELPNVTAIVIEARTTVMIHFRQSGRSKALSKEEGVSLTLFVGGFSSGAFCSLLAPGCLSGSSAITAAETTLSIPKCETAPLRGTRGSKVIESHVGAGVHEVWWKNLVRSSYGGRVPS